MIKFYFKVKNLRMSVVLPSSKHKNFWGKFGCSFTDWFLQKNLRKYKIYEIFFSGKIKQKCGCKTKNHRTIIIPINHLTLYNIFINCKVISLALPKVYAKVTLSFLKEGVIFHLVTEAFSGSFLHWALRLAPFMFMIVIPKS